MATNKLTKQDNIEHLWNKIDDRRKFILECSKAFDRRPETIRTHWFMGFYSVPEVFIDRVINMLQNTILNQNQQKSIAQE